MIEVVPYNPAWSQMFEEEAARIKRALGENCIAIHHIGSTAVPGLCAKPVIDMIPVVLDITEVDAATPNMQLLGYEAKGEFGMLFRRFFVKNLEVQSYHVHVFEQDNSEVERHVKFRDWMRTHEDDLTAYAALKQELALKYANDRKAYSFGKEAFIVGIDSKTGCMGLRIVHALTPREWENYHRIRKEQIFDPIHVIYDPHHPSLTMENHFHCVLYKGTTIVSVAHVELLNETEAALRSLATDGPFKNQGYGSHLLKLLEKWVKSQGRSIFKMHSNVRAEPFYRKFAYVDMPFDDHSINPQCVNLGKEL
jgi:GrpB-like predicted nucleotidyltransferase (UPF0157 family)/GNAT superfamily N-acetyltransferase